MKLLERGRDGLLVFTAMLEGCGYYGCKDDLKREYVPKPADSRWLNPHTLELDFGAALRPPTEVDPRRFALLRYNVETTGGNDYYCYFDVCYRQVSQVEAIPESLDWDASEPSVLRLQFADPLPSDSCKPWPGNRAHFQALELIYLGEEQPTDGTDTDDSTAFPDELAYDDDQPVEAIGPDQARAWLENCRYGSCEFDDFCLDRRGSEYGYAERDLWVDCP